MKKTTLKNVLICCSLFTLLSSTAWAAGGHGGHGSISDISAYFLNFAIFLALVFMIARKRFPKAWQERHQKIYNLVNFAEIELEAARKKLAKAQQEQASLATRITAMKEDHERTTTQEKNQIIASNQEQINLMRKQNELLIEAEKNAGKQEVEKELSEIVLNKAEILLKQEFSREQDNRYRSRLNANLKSLRAN